jgi:hypothetical protein
MGMKYKLAVKIMDTVVEQYLKNRKYRDDDPKSDTYGKILWEGLHADQIVEAYSRIRNG